MSAITVAHVSLTRFVWLIVPVEYQIALPSISLLTSSGSLSPATTKVTLAVRSTDTGSKVYLTTPESGPRGGAQPWYAMSSPLEMLTSRRGSVGRLYTTTRLAPLYAYTELLSISPME